MYCLEKVAKPGRSFWTRGDSSKPWVEERSAEKDRLKIPGGGWGRMTDERGLIQGHRRRKIQRSIVAIGEGVIKAHPGWPHCFS